MAKKKDESTIDREQVRDEHLDSVNAGAHWAALAGVLLGAFLVMVGLIAVLGSTAA